MVLGKHDIRYPKAQSARSFDLFALIMTECLAVIQGWLNDLLEGQKVKDAACLGFPFWCTSRACRADA